MNGSNKRGSNKKGNNFHNGVFNIINKCGVTFIDEGSFMILHGFKTLAELNKCSGWNYKKKGNLQRQINLHNGQVIPLNVSLVMHVQFTVKGIKEIKKLFQQADGICKLKQSVIETFKSQIHNILPRQNKQSVSNHHDKKRKAPDSKQQCVKRGCSFQPSVNAPLNPLPPSLPPSLPSSLKVPFVMFSQLPFGGIDPLSIEEEFLEKTGMVPSFELRVEQCSSTLLLSVEIKETKTPPKIFWECD